MFWIRYPLLRPVVLLATGIFLGECVPFVPLNPWWILVSVYAFYIVFFRYSGAFCWLTWIGLGFGLCQVSALQLERAPPEQGRLVIEEVRPTRSENWSRYIARADRRREKKGWYPDQLRIMVYLPRKVKLKPGDRLLYRGEIARPKPPLHPGVFDYRKYLRYQRIYGSAFLRDGTYLLLTPGRAWRYRMEEFRNRIKEKLIRWFPDATHGHLLAGMVLGEKSGLDAETRRIFSITGSMHVLAVSGLHVGLIYFLISLPLSLFSKRSFWPWIRWLLLLIALTCYACLAGFSPSVIRAVVFIVLFLFARLVRRPNPLSHVLFLTAMLMLLAEPFQLFRLSFQLSFQAVLGILLYMPVLDLVFSHRIRVVDYMLKNIGVSFAVQLTTLPLTILYFKQISLTFWLAASLVVPATFLMLLLSGGLFALEAVPVVHESIVLLISHLMDILIGALGWLSRLPSSHVTGLHAHWGWLFGFMFIVLLVVQSVRYKYVAGLRWFVIITCLMRLTYWIGPSGNEKNELVAVFTRRCGWHILQAEKNHGVLWQGDKSLCQETGMCEEVRSWFEYIGVEEVDHRTLPMKGISHGLLKIDQVNMVFRPKSDNFPKSRTMIIETSVGQTDTLRSLSGESVFYKIRSCYE